MIKICCSTILSFKVYVLYSAKKKIKLKLLKKRDKYVSTAQSHLYFFKINRNSSRPETFDKRFFAWFDAFRTLKFLNFALENSLEKQPLTDQSRKLLKKLNINPANSAKELLMQYRELQG